MLTLTSDMQVIVIGDDEGQEDDIHVHEDILIEEKGEEVFIANPTLPWWKQRRTKIVLGVCLVSWARGDSISSYGIIYARDLASMEAQQKAMILTFGICTRYIHILWKWKIE